MTPQEVQVVADAVKIGFPVFGTIAGALIGGVSTFLLTRLGQRNDAQKEFSKRRFELLIQTANDVAEFEHLIRTYASAVSNKIQGLKDGIDFEEARVGITTKNQPLRRARMSLKLLGLNEASSDLEAYIELTREVVRYGPNLARDRASELAKVIAVGPVQFYESLGREIALK